MLWFSLSIRKGNSLPYCEFVLSLSASGHCNSNLIWFPTSRSLFPQVNLVLLRFSLLYCPWLQDVFLIHLSPFIIIFLSLNISTWISSVLFKGTLLQILSLLGHLHHLSPSHKGCGSRLHFIQDLYCFLHLSNSFIYPHCCLQLFISYGNIHYYLFLWWDLLVCNQRNFPLDQVQLRRLCNAIIYFLLTHFIFFSHKKNYLFLNPCLHIFPFWANQTCILWMSIFFAVFASFTCFFNLNIL